MATGLGASLVPGGASDWACPFPGPAPPPHQPGREGGPHRSPTPGPPLWSQGQKPPRPPEPLDPCQIPGRKQRLQGLPPTSSVRARLTPDTLTLGPDLPGAGGPEPGGGPSTLGVLGVWEGLGFRKGDTAGPSSGTLHSRGNGVEPRINMGGHPWAGKRGLHRICTCSFRIDTHRWAGPAGCLCGHCPSRETVGLVCLGTALGAVV